MPKKQQALTTATPPQIEIAAKGRNQGVSWGDRGLRADGKAKLKAYSPRMIKFRDGYLAHGNATQAYLDAGYKPKNRVVANSKAGQLLRSRPMQELLAPVMQAAQLTPERIEELLRGRLESKPLFDEWTWNHWLRAMKMAQVLTSPTKGGGGVQIGTMNLVKVERAKKDETSVAATESQQDMANAIIEAEIIADA